MGSGRKILGGFLKGAGDHFSRSRLLDQEEKAKAERERQKIQGWKDLQGMEDKAAIQKQRMNMIDKASQNRLTANNKRQEAIAKAKSQLSENISKFMSISPESLEKAGLNIHPDLKEALTGSTGLDYTGAIETLIGGMKKQNPNLDDLSAITSLNTYLSTQLGKMEGYTDEQGELAKEERDLKTFKEKEDYKASLKPEKKDNPKPASIKEIQAIIGHFNAIKGIETEYAGEPPKGGYTPQQAQQLIEYGKSKGVVITPADLPIKKPPRPGAPQKTPVPAAKTPPGVGSSILGTAGQMLAHPINSVKTAGRTLLGGGQPPQNRAIPPTGKRMIDPIQKGTTTTTTTAPVQNQMAQQRPAGIDQTALKKPEEMAQQIIAVEKAGGDTNAIIAQLSKNPALMKQVQQIYKQLKQRR